ncbi:signal peptidase II [Novosphingobium sp. ZN18A2]|uniref:signal peptidase II n=1 Tax=Novosphingobium sp. ZN18A2 TaxID=3079861 RepID=UPI0030D49DD5
MKRVSSRRWAGFALAVVVFVLDRGVKAMMTGPLDLQGKGLIGLLPIFDLRWTENYGVSLGMFTATSQEMRWGLVAVTAVIALGVAAWMLRETNKVDLAGLGLVLGGALGNIWDRTSYGYVIDYADLHFGTWRPFLIFNLADAAITIGVLLLLARSLLLREKPAKQQSGDAATETR